MKPILEYKDTFFMAMVTITYIVMVAMNAASNVVFGDDATTAYSYSYLQPSGFTFSIWGVIYALQFIFNVAQIFYPAIRDDPRVIQARPSIVVCNLLNGFWLFSNGAAQRGNGISSNWTAAFILIGNVAYLYYGVYKNVAPKLKDMTLTGDWSNRVGIWESKDEAIFRWMAWYPFSSNLAWITIAATLNVSSCIYDHVYATVGYQPLTPTDLTLGPHIPAIGGADWAIGVAYAVTLLSVHNSLLRNDLMFSFVVAFALGGIYSNQTKSPSDMPADQQQSETLANAAVCGIAVVCVGVVLGWTKSLIQYISWKQQQDMGVDTQSDSGDMKALKDGDVNEESYKASDLTGV